MRVNAECRGRGGCGAGGEDGGGMDDVSDVSVSTGERMGAGPDVFLHIRH